ncbi:MAG: prenyltransferase, partial [Desulfovibrionaceae bacterium]|nr:prenyltransferase [Desulfovibrionaceae bacterium]
MCRLPGWALQKYLPAPEEQKLFCRGSTGHTSMACKIASWVTALRLPYFITSLIPPALAVCLLWKEQGSLQADTLSAFGLLLPGCLCMHAATNLFNDYYDTINGVDNPDSIGGSRVVLNGLLSLRDLRLGGIFSYILSFIFFAALSVYTGRLWIMSGWALGFMLSFFYVGPPLAYGYRGWGEAGSFMGMGWLLLFGSYLALGGG